ncbi:hypothetical protein MRB53_037646 [Persea americana]|nr:hypothetical protein MRB53_037646 [Persea americana]
MCADLSQGFVTGNCVALAMSSLVSSEPTGVSLRRGSSLVMAVEGVEGCTAIVGEPWGVCGACVGVVEAFLVPVCVKAADNEDDLGIFRNGLEARFGSVKGSSRSGPWHRWSGETTSMSARHTMRAGLARV